ncbi:MAG: hypothetical protein B9S37_08055 [Verrucomicrobiia bacterium Tous-C3TDCM]|nr:MAG: hypothetical protein B9S37_08055 [Verrucomicrobiae bacterium Tous-C3TDCM]PAZ05322.1 MAG: hypothetical protein CAK88_09490 [Verrucomicrobiae bacterium AMD-G2]
MEELLHGMRAYGWGIAKNCFGSEEAAALRDACLASRARGDLHRAGVGRGDDMIVREEIRSDSVSWLDEQTPSVDLSRYQILLEKMRKSLNQEFYLGLLDFEGHFAVYPAAGFYKAHLDRPQGTSDRTVAVILYLNEHWQPGDGGELRIWTNRGEKDGPFVMVQPQMGTMVCFLAEHFWHEVLPAHKERMSITGWFRQRSVI